MDYLDQVDLARRLLAGDESVLKELETDVWPVVRWRIEHRFVGRLSRNDMPDVLQEALLALWRGIANFDPSKGSLPSWFAGIAFKIAEDTAGRARVQQRQCERGSDLLEFCAAASGVDDTSESDEQPRSPTRRIFALRDCLARMSERRREILFAARACDGEPPTSRQLAGEFGTTPEVIRQELHRAEATVRNYFVDQGLWKDAHSPRINGAAGGGG